MNTFCPSGVNRPFLVHFLLYGEPDKLLVIAKSPCHAVQVMFRYFETYYHSIDCVDYDRRKKECYVEPLYFFSDTLYKRLKKFKNGNS